MVAVLTRWTSTVRHLHQLVRRSYLLFCIGLASWFSALKLFGVSDIWFFLSGRMRGSLATLERLVQIFPEDISLKNDLGVAHLLIGDNSGAKKVYEEVSVGG